MNGIISFRAVSMFFLVASTVFCAPYSDVVESSSSLQRLFFADRSSMSLETLLRKLNDYWFAPINHCDDSPDLITKEKCQMYYYGELSPFRDEDSLLNTSAARVKRE